MVAALKVLAVMVREKATMSELAACMEHFPQLLLNVRVREKPPLEALDTVSEARQEAERALGGDGRVVLRYSGTEPKARVMVEGREKSTVEHWAKHIAESIESAIGA